MRYTEAIINRLFDKFLHFLVEEIISGKESDDFYAKARKYLMWIASEASPQALLHAYVELAESENDKDNSCTAEIFDMVMDCDLSEYSTSDLEIIYQIQGWPSDNPDELDQHEMLVLEELQQREDEHENC